MGTKSVAKKGREVEKLRDGRVNSPKEANIDKDLSRGKDKATKSKTKRSEGKGNGSEAAENEGVNVGINSLEMHKEKNKKKRKREAEDSLSKEVEKQDKTVYNDNKIGEVKMNLRKDQTQEGVNTYLQKSVVGNDMKKSHKKKSKGKTDSSSSEIKFLKYSSKENADEGHGVFGGKDIFEMSIEEDGYRKKRKIKKRMVHEDKGEHHVVSSVTDRKDVGSERLQHNDIITDDGGPQRKEKKKKKKQQQSADLECESVKVMAETSSDKCIAIVENKDDIYSSKCQKRDENLHKDQKKKKQQTADFECQSVEVMAETSGERHSAVGDNKDNMDSAKNKKREGSLNKDIKKRKKQKREHGVQGEVEAANPRENSAPKGPSKRVSFAEEVEIFQTSDGPSDEGTVQDPLMPSDGPCDEGTVLEDELVQGKRFSPEEDKMLKEAVFNYIESHNLGENGLYMVMHCKKHREIKNCWKDIRAALPWRTHSSIYYRAHILFERDESRSWTKEQMDIMRKFHEKYGADWRTLGDEIGKNRVHLKDTWRRIKLANMNVGKWSQEEYQTLFDLVNMDLRMKAFEEQRLSKHGMLRDNIGWTAISEKLGTRATPACCIKWYRQLASPMVAAGLWSDLDDFHLLAALYELDACCLEDVDWDNLLEHRPGEICRKRWNQMVKHLGEHASHSFADQVEVLMQRYCPDVLEAREAYNSKPLV